MRYDESKRPRPKYHHYTLSMLRFFCQNYFNEQRKQSKEVGIQWSTHREGFTDPGYIRLENLEEYISLYRETTSADDLLTGNEAVACYEKVRDYLLRLQNGYRRFAPRSWQASAHDIFMAMTSEESLTNLANKLGISRTSILKWKQNVYTEVRKYIGVNPFDDPI